MPLTWKTTDETSEKYPNVCVNPDVPEDERLYEYNPVTSSIVMNMFVMGVRELTADNIHDTIARYHLMTGALASWQEPYVKPKQWVDHIGLTTNVSQETRASFDKRMHEMAVRTARELTSQED